jgi:hypothetical protein
MAVLGKKSGEYFLPLFSRYLTTVDCYSASGHHHENCQKNVHTPESSGKHRGTRLLKNSVDCSSDGGAVNEIWWVFGTVQLS